MTRAWAGCWKLIQKLQSLILKSWLVLQERLSSVSEIIKFQSIPMFIKLGHNVKLNIINLLYVSFWLNKHLNKIKTTNPTKSILRANLIFVSIWS